MKNNESNPEKTTPVLIDFNDLALGARFRYTNGEKVWIKLDNIGRGKIAEYDKDLITHKGWIGQSICSAKDEDNELLMVIFDS